MSEPKKQLRPSDIPLIITSTNSNLEFARKGSEGNPLLSDEPPPDQAKEEVEEESGKRKCLGGSLKYEIGRNRSMGNIIPVKAKWSSVRIRGTGYNDSRKSVVKVEPCNGIGTLGTSEYMNLANAHQNMKKGGEVSIVCFSVNVNTDVYFTQHVLWQLFILYVDVNWEVPSMSTLNFTRAQYVSTTKQTNSQQIILKALSPSVNISEYLSKMSIISNS